MKTNAFLEQAQTGRNDFWRYLVNVGAIIFVSIWISILISIVSLVLFGSDFNQYPPQTVLIIGMLPFPFVSLTLWLGVRFLHQRTFLSLITPLKQVNWKRILVSASIWLILAGFADVVLSFLQPGNYMWSFDVVRFLPYMVIAFIFIPIQTSTEELIFRSYLPQGLSRFTPRFWIPWVIPALVFGLLHSLNPEVGLYGFLLTIPYYIGFGLMLGWVTLKSQSLELALGLHLANNLYASLVVTFPGSALPSPALFTIKEYNAAAALIVWAVMTGIYLLIMLTLFRKWFKRDISPELPAEIAIS